MVAQANTIRLAYPEAMQLSRLHAAVFDAAQASQGSLFWYRHRVAVYVSFLAIAAIYESCYGKRGVAVAHRNGALWSLREFLGGRPATADDIIAAIESTTARVPERLETAIRADVARLTLSDAVATRGG